MNDFGLLVGATAPPDTVANRKWANSGFGSGVSPSALLALAQIHDMVVPMARVLDRGPASDLRARFAEEARRLTQRSMWLTAELVLLAGRFALSGLPLIALKGPALSHEIFGDPMARDPGDLDLQIRPEDLAEADRLLLSLGYRREPRWNAEFASGDLRRPLDWVNHIEYDHEGKNISVELHIRWFYIDEIMVTDPKLIWENTRRLRIANGFVTVLSAPMQLLYLCFHAAKHECERLKWVNDLSWMLANLDDTEVAEALALARRLDAVDLFLAPILCAVEIGAAILPPSLAPLSQRPGALRLAAICRGGLEHPPRRSDNGTWRQSLRRQRTYWRLALYRDHPRRLALLARLVEMRIAAARRLPSFLARIFAPARKP